VRFTRFAIKVMVVHTVTYIAVGLLALHFMYSNGVLGPSSGQQICAPANLEMGSVWAAAPTGSGVGWWAFSKELLQAGV
jgi:hypothetical protein